MDDRRCLERPLLSRAVIVALVSWTALWVGLGTATALELWRLRQLAGVPVTPLLQGVAVAVVTGVLAWRGLAGRFRAG